MPRPSRRKGARIRLSDEIKDGSSPEVRDEARTEMPLLHKHLRLAERALAASR